MPGGPAVADAVGAVPKGRGLTGAGAGGKAAALGLVVRVLPDVVRLNRTFDYVVPDAWHADGRAGRLAVGSIVRVRLGGRRLRGWVTEVGVAPPAGVELQPLLHLTGMGPPADVIDLAGWAAWRWAGSRVSLLRAGSPERVVTRPTPPPAGPAVAAGASGGGRYDRLFERSGAVTVLRCPPADDAVEVAQAAARRGDALIVVPGLAAARRVAAGLRRQGTRVGLGFDDWGRAAAGATVVGTRTAVWMPMPDLAAVVVIDEHSESLQSEQAPTWNAREVALERARRAGVPTVLTSPVPSLEALAAGELETVGRAAERDGWPVVEVLDRRGEDPVRGGLFAPGLRDRLAAAGGRVVVVLNRKGRGRLLACKACGELVRTSDGTAPMQLHEDELVSPDGSERRPVVCAECGSTVLRVLRAGVTRAREELAALVGEPVAEVTSAGSPRGAGGFGGSDGVRGSGGLGRGSAGTGRSAGVHGSDGVRGSDVLRGADGFGGPDGVRGSGGLRGPDGVDGLERIVIGTEAVLWRVDAAEVAVFLDFDQELLAPRQRAGEQALALLARAARPTGGRRGGGRLIVQTRQPDHPVVQAAVRADPSRAASFELSRRCSLGLPPCGAQAQVSGPGAQPFVDALRALAVAGDDGGAVSVRGPRDGSFLLRAADHAPLLDLLARTPRPAERLRIEVDPLRA